MAGRRDPPAATIAFSGFLGAVLALIPWPAGERRTERTPASARRGVRVALAAGVPYFTGLLLLCLLSGGLLGFAVCFAVILVVLCVMVWRRSAAH